MTTRYSRPKRTVYFKARVDCLFCSGSGWKDSPQRDANGRPRKERCHCVRQCQIKKGR